MLESFLKTEKTACGGYRKTLTPQHVDQSTGSTYQKQDLVINPSLRSDVKGASRSFNFIGTGVRDVGIGMRSQHLGTPVAAHLTQHVQLGIYGALPLQIIWTWRRSMFRDRYNGVTGVYGWRLLRSGGSAQRIGFGGLMLRLDVAIESENIEKRLYTSS